MAGAAAGSQADLALDGGVGAHNAVDIFGIRQLGRVCFNQAVQHFRNKIFRLVNNFFHVSLS